MPIQYAEDFFFLQLYTCTRPKRSGWVKGLASETKSLTISDMCSSWCQHNAVQYRRTNIDLKLSYVLLVWGVAEEAWETGKASSEKEVWWWPMVSQYCGVTRRLHRTASQGESENSGKGNEW